MNDPERARRLRPRWIPLRMTDADLADEPDAVEDALLSDAEMVAIKVALATMERHYADIDDDDVSPRERAIVGAAASALRKIDLSIRAHMDDDEEESGIPD